MQSQLNAQAINKLTAIKSVISNSDEYTANQMRIAAIRSMLNSHIAIDSMSDKQVVEFENSLLIEFRYKNWI